MNTIPVENLRCLRDPDCLRHHWHAGHVHSIGPIDPRELYAARQRRKHAGRRAYKIVREMEQAWGHPKYMLTPMQRDSIIRVLQHEFLFSQFMSS